jgi:hypothetical protein
MNLHANATTCPNSRALIARRVIEQAWSLRSGATSSAELLDSLRNAGLMYGVLPMYLAPPRVGIIVGRKLPAVAGAGARCFRSRVQRLLTSEVN